MNRQFFRNLFYGLKNLVKASLTLSSDPESLLTKILKLSKLNYFRFRGKGNYSKKVETNNIVLLFATSTSYIVSKYTVPWKSSKRSKNCNFTAHCSTPQEFLPDSNFCDSFMHAWTLQSTKHIDHHVVYFYVVIIIPCCCSHNLGVHSQTQELKSSVLTRRVVKRPKKCFHHSCHSN